MASSSSTDPGPLPEGQGSRAGPGLRASGARASRGSTGWRDLDATLASLLAGVRRALGERLVGLYLYGSLADGDFDPETSDVDFLVLTEGALPQSAVERLRRLHARLAAGEDRWARKLEGSYLPRDELRRYRPDGPVIPHVNEGRFYLARHGPDWVIQRRTLRERGVVVAGPPIRPLIDPVGPDEARAAVGALLREWWAPMLEERSRLRRPDYQAYAVLSMCRALRALADGEVVSKPAAARWAEAELGDGWVPLVRAALTWREGQPLDREEEVVELIRLTVRRTGVGEPPV